MKKKLLIFSFMLAASASIHCYWGRGGYGWGLGWGLGYGGLYAPYYNPYYSPYYYHPYPYYPPPARSVSPAALENAKTQGKLEALKNENNRKEQELERKRRQKLNDENRALRSESYKARELERQKELQDIDNNDDDNIFEA